MTVQLKDYEIDVRWVMRELLEENAVAQEDFNIITTTPRERHELKWHPLELVAKYQLTDLKNGGVLTVAKLSEWMAEKVGLPLYRIDPLKVNVGAITSIMSHQFADRQQIMAVEVSDDRVLVGVIQPFLDDWRSGLQQIIGDRTIEVVFVNPADLRRYLAEFYNLSRSIDQAEGQQLSGISNFEQLLELGKSSNDANDQHIVAIVDWILQYAFDQRASDIHLEPRRDIGRMRFRIDGVLHDVYELPANIMAAVTSRLKILSRLNVAEKRRPQDGRLKTKSPKGDEIELRISTLPTAFGEKMVMRIFDPEVLLRGFNELGFSRKEHQMWKDMTERPNGIVLVTGPTGSGKTTTLYSTLKHLATPQVNVCTIEDPIEMIEPVFNQMQVQGQIDVGFADGVRALLRQDPDIIMIGEIRDLETAEMAIQAALTGHLVLSTLHTNDAPSTVTRLIELGVPYYLINATVAGVMAQRLLRTLCPHCKKESEVSDEDWAELVRPWKVEKPEKIYHADGCIECRGTGYLGRVGAYEVMPLNSTIRSKIGRENNLEALRRIALKDGLKPLRLVGVQKVISGITTIEEVLRVTPALEIGGE